MKTERCRNCGKPIAKWAYGSGTRWTHLVEIAGVPTDAGIFCRVGRAEP